MLGLTSDDEPSGGGAQERTPTARDRPAAADDRPREDKPDARLPRRKRVRLEVVAARPVWVCVVDGSGNERVGGVVLAAGDREGPFRSRSFRVTVGNGGGDLRIDGRRRDTPDRSRPLGYSVRPSGVTVLSQERSPTCG